MEHYGHSSVPRRNGGIAAPVPATMFPGILFILLHLSLLAMVGLLLLR